MEFLDALPPRRLLRLCHFRQPPGEHPGQPPGRKRTGKWALEAGVEVVELVLRGRGWIWSEGMWEEVTAGALLWHREGDQTIAKSDWDDPYQCLAVAFESEAQERRTARLAWWRDLEAVQQFSQEAVRAWMDGATDAGSLCAYVYGRLLYESRRGYRQALVSQFPEPLQEVLEWIEGHFMEPISVEEMAERVGWSAPHLHEVFKKRLQSTPYQFILDRRVQLARQYLAASEASIKEVAAHCGFANAPAFCHVFKNRTGQTPLHYRKAQRRLAP